MSKEADMEAKELREALAMALEWVNGVRAKARLSPSPDTVVVGREREVRLPYGFLNWLEGEANEASEYAGAFIQEGGGKLPEHIRAREAMLHDAFLSLSSLPVEGGE